MSDLTTSVSNYLLRSHDKSEDEADAKLSPFLRKQKKRLLALRDAMLDSMNGVAQDNLRPGRKATKPARSACIRPTPAAMPTTVISR